MALSLGMEKATIESLVKAFSGSTKGITNEVKLEQGWHTGNFENGGSWDTRFGRIRKAALHKNLVVLQRKRGIWEYILVLDIDTRTLYAFSKEKNFDVVIKKLGKKSIHYFHAFVSLNNQPVNLDNHQLEFFPRFTDEYEERRIEEVRKILAEDYPRVNKVIFVIGKEENNKIVNVEAKLYNQFFELIDVEDWSTYVASDQYDEIFVPNAQISGETEKREIIPKVKQSIKDRRNSERRITRVKNKQQDIEGQNM
ncbi:DUF5986 family protein [Bacillus sp. V5-8f]|uniref:DUF5986 family protein n=1 Tax=Bacillus sp. V5-8f TaxID=2053044 RepID=UPI000C78C685|nr:DUF5986 family protein [Bacillus sp. V5-8f]PLT33660.1 hypothetical protein CUU64_11055 [Bacillus sp. V5-8f]